MRISKLYSRPVASFQFLNAARRRSVPNVERIFVLRAECSGLPHELDAVIAAADLQGLEHWSTANGNPPRLMGDVLPELLRDRVLPELSIDAAKTGVFLCGDLYTVPGAAKRGGTGDVTSVWYAFADVFPWVAGVAGNHDMFGNRPDSAPKFPHGMWYLDGETVTLNSVVVSGVGGVIGSPDRNQRRTEADYCTLLELILAHTACDVLLLHDGPDGPEAGQKGSSAIRSVVETYNPPLVIRGHAHWRQPLVELEGGSQVLNVDSRIVILTHADAS